MRNPGLILIVLSAACADHQFPAVISCEAVSLSFQIKSITPATDCSTFDATVRFSAGGGRKPYFFSQDGVTWSKDSTLRSLASNVYSFLLKDADGCVKQIDSTVTSANAFPFTILSSADTKCVENDGAIRVLVDGDSSGFEYRIDQQRFSQNSVFYGLKEGDHTIYVRNIQGCTAITIVKVPRAPTQVSWVNDVLPIMTNSCATSGCHDGLARLDWRDYNEVKQFAQAIKQRTQERNMPPDKTLPQDQIDKIACWVDDGALNN